MSDAVEEIEHAWIELADGCRLAARLWLPADARAHPVPALLEYLPYRKRDFTRARDEPMHGYFARHGYASVRVDIRGSGDSEGLLEDEYTRQEIDDAVEVIAHLARQPWCDGTVGMFGISWGGFNALQTAARRPPALKAIITLCASDDRYSDDAHYMGGCLLTENLQWGAIFMLNQALPPDPAVVGTSWREAWRDRIEHLPNFPANWLQHPTRDEYWRQGSVSDEIDAIAVPVFAIGGWADGYSNAVLRLVRSLTGPCKGLIGPWAHTYPHIGKPGPAIGFLQEAVRWWDRWLKGENNGVDGDPALRVWMQEYVKPAPQYESIPGRWVAETSWPSQDIQPWTLFLTSRGLSETQSRPQTLSVRSPQTCGVRAGEWCAFGSDGEMPRDQRPDDGFSLVFDSEPLAASLEILGAPVVDLVLSADQAMAAVTVRLCDVAPDGASLRVTYGALNLTHRGGHDDPAPLVPGDPITVRLALNDIAHRFPTDHRIRIAISTSYWPIVWPSPTPVCISLRANDCHLELPVRSPRASDAELREFPAPDAAPGATVNRLRKHDFLRALQVDLTTNETRYQLEGADFDDASVVRLSEIQLDVGYTLSKRFRIREDDPLSAAQTIEQRATLRRDDWRVGVELTMAMQADADHFVIEGDLVAKEGQEHFAQRHFRSVIPRRCL